MEEDVKNEKKKFSIKSLFTPYRNKINKLAKRAKKIDAEEKREAKLKQKKATKSIQQKENLEKSSQIQNKLLNNDLEKLNNNTGRLVLKEPEKQLALTKAKELPFENGALNNILGEEMPIKEFPLSIEKEKEKEKMKEEKEPITETKKTTNPATKKTTEKKTTKKVAEKKTATKKTTTKKSTAKKSTTKKATKTPKTAKTTAKKTTTKKSPTKKVEATVVIPAISELEQFTAPIVEEKETVVKVAPVKLEKEVEEKTTPIEEVKVAPTIAPIKEKKENNEPKIKVLYVAGECQPFVATGGLGEVAGSLPKAIAKVGNVDIRVILPLYESIKNKYKDELQFITSFTTHLAWRREYCGIFYIVKDGVTYYFIDNERYFKREKPYGYFDDGERFAYFCKSIVECLPVIDFFPNIIHCNDWHSALVSAYIKTGDWSDSRYYQIRNIYTIHNVEYQGIYGMENLEDLFGINCKFRNAIEYNGNINVTKAAIQYADKLTTVSESYCDNLKQEYCSVGLHHIIRRNEYKLSGIINGIDYDVYNPATDEIIYEKYDINHLEKKAENKLIWQRELGLTVDKNIPMLSIVSRLVSHKGIGLLMQILEGILARNVQLVVVGTGDQKYVDYFKYLQAKYPTKVRAMVDKYSYELGRKAYAASDIFLMPSKIEPCGISQMIASRYASVPIVREVGGLKDSIKDFGCEHGGNGYTFADYNANDLKNQINRAITDFKDKKQWTEKMKTVMKSDFTWEKSALKYIDLYKSLL